MQRTDELKKSDYISLVSLICIILFTQSEVVITNNGAWSIFGIIGGLMQTLGSLGYPLAIMASGCILTKKNENIYSYYKSIIKLVILPMIIYYLICKVLSFGAYTEIWFTSVLIGVFICTPFLNALIINISDKMLKILIFLIILARFIQIYLPLIGIHIGIDLWIFNNWMVYYIIGYALTKITSEKTKKDIYKFGIISLILTFMLRSVNIDFQIFGVSPTMMLLSAAAFMKILDFKTDKIIKYTYINMYLKFLNKHKIGIYLIHNYIVINLLQNKLNLHSNRFKVVFGSLLVFVITLILAGILALIVDKYLITIVNKISKNIVEKIKSNDLKQKIINNRQYIIWILASMLLLILIEAISRGSIESAVGFSSSQAKRFFINYLIVLTVTSPCLLFKRVYFVFTIISEVLMILVIASYVVANFRGFPITYSDLYSIKDGISIAKQYINIGLIVGLVLILLILGLIASRTFRYKVKNTWKLKKISILGIFILAIFTNLSINKGLNKGILIPNPVDLKMSYEDNGFTYSLYHSYESYKRKKPSLYNKENITKIKDKLKNITAAKENEESPNIIVLQLESVMDPKRIEGIKLSKDPIKNIRKATEKYSSGALYVPSFGGGTARTEFEIVTGINVDYLSPGEIPHSSILKKKPVESLAYTLGRKNYESTLIHNHEGSFYERNTVYENLGFKRFIPIEYMYNIEYPYSWASDKLILDNIKQTLKSTEKRDFVFALGVQTHGGYSYDYQNEDSEVVVTGDLPQEQLNQLQDYIDDLVMVDEVVGKLIDYVDSLEEPTILAVYSDHLPYLDVVNDQLTEKEKYTTEYFIYDNMGSKKKDKDIEAYELSTEVLNRASITGGVMNQFHRAYKNDSDYYQNLELLQYDILNGNNYVFGGDSLYKRTKIELGLKDITINNVKIDGNKIKVIGDGFNKFSSIYVNGKSIETEYISNKELIGNLSGSEVKEVTVHQISRYSKSIGKTNTYIVDKK